MEISMAKAPKKSISFEENLNRIEIIVAELERQGLPLEQAINQYEEGVKLIKECQKILTEAEQKVLMLSDDKNE